MQSKRGFFKLPYDLRDKERKNEERKGKKDLQREELTPVTTGPNLFDSTNEKGENKRPDDDAQPGAEKVVPEPDLCKPHSEIHSCEGEIDKTQVEHRSKSVPFDSVIVFLESVSDEGGGKFPP